MKLIGITGGIGSGKSTIAKVFLSMGFPIYNSDDRAQELINVNLAKEIKSHFGDDIYLNGKLNRKKMASLVFNNPEKLAQLNQIVHPAVAQDFENWAKNQTTSLVFKEAAILFETGSYKKLDATVLVTADKQIRIKRVMQRDSVSEKDVIARMKNQWSDSEKIKLADFIIDNSGDKMVIPQIIEMLSKLAT